MKRRGADDAIKSILEGQVEQIAGNKVHTLTVFGKMIAGRSQHVLREISGNYAALWQSFQKIRCKAAGSTASVEHKVVSTQFEAREDSFAPTNLRTRKAMVNGRIPLAGHGSGLVCQRKLLSF